MYSITITHGFHSLVLILQRARRAGRRQARSRRELERLTVAQDPEEMKHLQDKNHAVNRLEHVEILLKPRH